MAIRNIQIVSPDSGPDQLYRSPPACALEAEFPNKTQLDISRRSPLVIGKTSGILDSRPVTILSI